MSIFDAGHASISGVWDQFDRANGVADWLEKLIKEGDLEVELHPQTVGTPAHFYDTEAELLAQLVTAREHVNAARLICQTVLAAI